MKLNELIRALSEWAPLNLQESYDNSGLLVGDPEQEVDSLLVCLDVTEAVLEEANARGCNAVLAHHPLIFSGLKRLTGSTAVERCVAYAIRNNMAVLAWHTNLDSVQEGVSGKMAALLGLENVQVLRPAEHQILKLVTYVPPHQLNEVEQALFDAGAGSIGAYSQCSFVTGGTGGFLPMEGANPYLGQVGERELTEEARLEVVFPVEKKQAVLQALFSSHPYETVAYELLQTLNPHQQRGFGAVGNLPEPMDWRDALALVKKTFRCAMIRHTAPVSDQVERIALCGGSGSFLLNDAQRAGAQLFLTADFKYHQFFEAEGKLQIADIGHFESEQFTMDLMQEYLNQKFPTFAVLLTEINTNPIHYL